MPPPPAPSPAYQAVQRACSSYCCMVPEPLLRRPIANVIVTTFNITIYTVIVFQVKLLLLPPLWLLQAAASLAFNVVYTGIVIVVMSAVQPSCCCSIALAPSPSPVLAQSCCTTAAAQQQLWFSLTSSSSSGLRGALVALQLPAPALICAAVSWFLQRRPMWWHQLSVWFPSAALTCAFPAIWLLLHGCFRTLPAASACRELHLIPSCSWLVAGCLGHGQRVASGSDARHEWPHCGTA
jgi:hypothetical protein